MEVTKPFILLRMQLKTSYIYILNQYYENLFIIKQRSFNTPKTIILNTCIYSKNIQN